MGLKHHWSYEAVADRLRATETSEIRIPTSGKVHVALIFPGVYAVGMSNLGFLTAHRLFCSMPDTAVERFFFPLEAGFLHKPPFYSFETRRPLGDFDVLAFSLSFEGDFDRLPHILGPLEIPVLAAKRKKGMPLLIAGGAAVGSNPDALSRVFDVLVPGEAETTLVPLWERLVASRGNLEELKDLPGIWVPKFSPKPNPPVSFHDINQSPAFAHISTTENVFGGAHLIEVMRGCPRTCAFCLARKLYHPPRPLFLESFVKWLDQRPQVRDLGLIAPSLFDHPDFLGILKEMRHRNIRVRNSSVKWEKLSEEVLNFLETLGPKSLTLAPETGSARLREEMGKALMQEPFYDTIRRVLDHGFERLKLYFMVGLPGETTEDLEATVALLNGVIREFGGKPVSLGVTFSGFVPKKRTPWEACEVLPAQEFKQKFRFLKSRMKQVDYPVKVGFESPAEIVRQAFLCRVGPEYADELEGEAKKCKERGGFVAKQDIDGEF